MTDCTVIMPIGPGHETVSQSALQSIVLASEDLGEFEMIHAITGDDTKGQVGRSAARNRMVNGYEDWMGVFSFSTDDDKSAAFKSEWLFFLDADDLMCSPKTHHLYNGRYAPTCSESAFSVASKYLQDYDCIWGTIYELHQNGDVFKRNQVDRIATYKAFVKKPSFVTCQMGHFIRRDKFLEIGGFNEEMDVCEDVDLYLREWKSLRCIKQEKPLFLNRRGAHSWMVQQARQGMRKTHTGRDWSIKAEEMLKEARKFI